ncbi:MAG TPA: PSD1 and planctomycete cytochrome C domain-containing protein [Gemmataceae bacterium]|nr:PSD1 and planctomycete cytochrome C domain-containing protein [Gemmataceae bacterium]
MRYAFLPLACAAALLAGSSARAADPDPKGVEFFESKIRPVLVEQCYKCHSAQSGKSKGGLALDTRAAVLKGGDTGAAVVPGNAEKSLLLAAIRHEGDVKMPPKTKLPDAVVSDFRRWVEMGAPDPRERAAATTSTIDWGKARDFWSFRPVRKPAAPGVKDAAWPKTEIDRFILARLEAEGLHHAAPADKRALLRRATFDLTGLPPTPDEIDTFLKDDSSDAFAKVVDRLLKSPHYGECWGRHWLDVARYAEDQAHTFGVKPNTEAYHYRDWVIDALNADMPYDRFVKRQIAADLMDGAKPEGYKQLAALGFFGLGAVYYKGGVCTPKAIADELDDRVDTLSRGLLGLTVACARCHDHKYDPIPTQDYYSLAGVFSSCKLASLPMVPKAEADRYAESQKPLLECDKKLKELQKAEKSKPTADGKQRVKDLQAEMEKLKKAAPPAPPMAHALAEAAPADMHVFVRGNPEQQGDVAPRRFLRVLAGDDPPHFTHGSGRLELADAIASKNNPLTARVIVNRVWAWHFGRGIVGTPSNFGQLGERPTHPELLDDLAARFVENGWSLKWLHREIMLSATYQQDSSVREPINQDPDNRLLSHMNRRRLEVEAYRDALLAVSGQLDASFGGPTADLAAGQNRRRTVYCKVSRHELNGLLRLFDFPDANITSERRTVTTVPQQQLFVLNSPFVIGRAKALAARVAAEGGTDAERVRRAYLLAYARPATEPEVALALRYLGGKDDPAEKNALTRWERYAQALLAANEFLYVD